MSSASKAKLIDKLSAKAVKGQDKVSLKASAIPNHGNDVPSNVYNPDSGTFHNIDTTSSGSLLMSQNSGRFRTIDETEDHSFSSFATTGEFDSIYNHNGYSGEEDQKEKTTSSCGPRIESILGCDIDKREKIRQKNERKHQRQKERRAQDLHERCSNYLISRKLEMLAQKIIVMGFSSAEATMALIQNEGRVEESIAWLLELSEESRHHTAANVDSSNSPKIDITPELAKISEMELKFKCTRQEVERAVVACEGDLKKAEETLTADKQEVKAASSKLEEADDSVSVNDFDNKMAMPVQTALSIPKQNRLLPDGTSQLRDERDLNYNKTVTMEAVKSTNKNLHSLRRILPKPDWGRPQVVPPIDQRWSIASTAPSVSCPWSSSLQVAVPLTNRFAMTSNEPKPTLPTITLRDPVMVMPKLQSSHTKQDPASAIRNISATPPASTRWYPNKVSSMEMMLENGGLGPSSPYLGLHGSSAQQFVDHNNFLSGSRMAESFVSNWDAGPFNFPSSSASSLMVPSSLGLFTGSPSGLSSTSSVNWSSDGSTLCDYTSIDWSMDTAVLKPSIKNTNLSLTWSTMFMGGKAPRPAMNSADGAYIAGLQDGSLVHEDSMNLSGSHDWSSPFAGNDLLSVLRRYFTNSSI
ncbi:uncharacterized protein LOC122012571 [Zingiber officinale]|uniref:uncharacterized protein LOC122012571 n=1 Tax=Zingiber officinale TaxID=94328 RepID=UPI001C4B48E8|nr:uncharacterized protein LOC122012571 [Zingiber officinale]XP_042425088.1 uncharacterized protein LOC122012571 [Zingiber officinale]XP_042425089.1 uncharacterized protein LOC122012571 [Zingiber officinale]